MNGLELGKNIDPNRGFKNLMWGYLSEVQLIFEVNN